MPFTVATLTRRNSGRIAGDEVEYVGGEPSFRLASVSPTADDGSSTPLPPGNPFTLIPSSCDGSGYLTLKKSASAAWAAAFAAGRRVRVRMHINNSTEENCIVQLQSSATIAAMVTQAQQARASAERAVAELTPLIANLESLRRRIDPDPDCKD
jgi:hypothetical protein